MKKRYLFVLLVILAYVSLFIGVKDIKLIDLITLDNEKLNIFMISRIPRLLSVLVTGVGMSICGLIMQQITKNKFVSPTTGATIDAASLGMVLSMVFLPSLGIFGSMILAFICSIVGTMIFIYILRNLKFKNQVFVPLVGIMFGNIISSISSFIGYKYEIMQSVTAFMQGNFSLILKGNYELLYITVPLIIVAYLYANKFTIAGMGEDFATNLGLNYNRIVNIGLVIVALVTSSVIITVGQIPFIGLIVPNIVKMYKGENVKDIIFHTALFGAIFVLACDMISRLIIFPYEVPIGLTVGVIGSVIFFIMIIRRSKYAG